MGRGIHIRNGRVAAWHSDCYLNVGAALLSLLEVRRESEKNAFDVPGPEL
jgi:hypothetical protein